MDTQARMDAGGPEIEFRLLGAQEGAPAWRPALEVVFVLEGTGRLHIEGGGSDYTLQRGDIFVVNGFQMRGIALDEGATVIALYVSPAFLAAFSAEMAAPAFGCKSFLHGDGRQQPFDLLRRDFARAFRAYYKNESPHPFHLRSKVVALLDTLFEHFLLPEQDRGAASGRERLRGAVAYIHQHYRQAITLDDLASHVYLSASYISRSFQRHFGVSFRGYLAQVRLLHATALLRGDATITDIAYASGFPSANAMIMAFKQYRGSTPGQYRARLRRESSGAAARAPAAAGGFSTIFASLMQYAEGDEAQQAGAGAQTADTLEISADLGKAKGPTAQGWRRVVNSGYARDLLDAAHQGQMARLQRSVGFEYIRCKGMLDDDMVLCTRDILGRVEMNYVYVDEVIDCILGMGAKPMLELSHMPSIMAKNTGIPFRRPTVISAPADVAAWEALIERLMTHWVRRYGVAKMRDWLFAPWTSPDFSTFAMYTLDEYAITYAASYRAIKRALPGARICGPGSAAHDGATLSWFIDTARAAGCLPDVLTFRSFAAVAPDLESGALNLAQSTETFPLAVSGDEDYLATTSRALRAVLRQQGAAHLPIMLEEWSNNIWQRDLCNDTSYKSAYLFKSILESAGDYAGMGYFSLGDQLDEIAPAAEQFHGGFGLFTRGGLPKAAYRAYQLLARQGGRVLARGKGYAVTASDEAVQVYLYNYAHYDTLYRYRHTTHLSQTDRYRVFNEKRPVACSVYLTGMAPGAHTVRRYSIGPQGGSSYDAWVAMGAPQPISAREAKALARLSHPVYHTEQVHVDGTMLVKAYLAPHEVVLLELSR